MLLRGIAGLLGASAIIKDCGKSSYLAKYVSGSLDPVTPIPGQNLTVTVNYDMREITVTGGTVTYDYSWNYIPFEPTVDDLCSQTFCPKEALMSYTETSTSVFPMDVSGYIVSTFEWADQNGNPVLCVETDFNL